MSTSFLKYLQDHQVQCVAWDFDCTILTRHAGNGVAWADLDHLSRFCVSKDFLVAHHLCKQLGIREAVVSSNEEQRPISTTHAHGASLIYAVLQRAIGDDAKQFFIIGRNDTALKTGKNAHCTEVTLHYRVPPSSCLLIDDNADNCKMGLEQGIHVWHVKGNQGFYFANDA